MLLGGEGRRIFSLLVMFLFVTQLTSPFAYAAPSPSPSVFPSPSPSVSPTPKPSSSIPYPADIRGSGSCTVSTMTDAERETLWANTATKPIQQLTDVPIEAALNQANAKVSNPLDPSSSLNPASAQTVLDQQITLASLIPFGEGKITKDKLLKYVDDYDSNTDNADDVLQNTTVTVSQANEIMKRELRGSTALTRWNEIFNNMLGGKKEIDTIQLPQGTPNPYANLKVVIPGSVGEDGTQREVTYAQIAAASAMNPDSCLLKGTIKGRVSYLAVLNSDITYGIPGNQTLSGKYLYPPSGAPDVEINDPRSNQWFVGSSIISVLSLNGGANVLLPSFYEDWIAFTGKWSHVDLWVSVGVGLAAHSATARLEKIVAEKKELSNSLLNSQGARQQVFGNVILDKVQGKIEVDAASGAYVFSRGGNEYLVDVQTLPLPAGGTGQFVVIRDRATPATVISADQVGPGIANADDVITSYNLNAKRTGQGLEAAVETGIEAQHQWDRVKKLAIPRVSYNLMMGAAWMGPARFAYDIADRNLFAAAGFNQNKYLKVSVNKEVAVKFREATNLLGIGRTEEIIAEYTGGTPRKAFSSGKVFLANFPFEGNDARESITSISQEKGWSVVTNWKGASSTVNFEDIRYFTDANKYTSLPVVTNEILPQSVINRKLGGNAINYLLVLAAPLLLAKRLVPEVGQTLGFAGTLLAAEEIFEIDPNYGKGVECDPAELDRLKGWYRTWILTDYAFTALTAFGLPLLKTAHYLSRQVAFTGKIVADVQAWTNPFLLAQWYIGNEAQIYTANCKDSQYKILSYQRLPEATLKANKTASETASNVVQDITQSFTNTFSGKDEVKDELGKYSEILNLKSQIRDQQGFVQPEEIVAQHIEKSAWWVPGGIFDTLNGTGCTLDETLITADGGALSISKNGLKKINKDGSVAFDFNDFYWKLRAGSILRSQELARMIVPNHIITTLLDCGDKPFIGISTSGSSALLDKTCAGGCLEKELKTLVDFDGTNLEKVFGKITSVDTTFGTAVFTGDSITFTRTSLGDVGVATRAPTLESAARTAGLGTSTAGVSLNVLGNGQVTLSSPSDFGSSEIGTLKTIIGEKGKIEFDPVVKRLYVFIYVLGEGKAQTIADITAKASTVNSDGKTIPVINLDLRGKRGFEDIAKQLQDALDKIQKDSLGNEGGMQIFETPDKIYKFNPDGTLTITDKKTGATETFKITGQPFTDANGNVVFPTDKGNITFAPGVNAQGQPIINVTGPGIKDEGILEAAKGPGGIFTFNPSTGAITVYNGQDLPMDPRFATQGMSFVGTPEGTRGVPGSNPFALPPTQDDSFERRRSSLSLPVWPAETLWFAAMMGVILVGIMFVRSRKDE